MIYYVASDAKRPGDGSRERPFKTINAAARLAVAGDEIVVAPGVYREYVNPRNGGTEKAPIVYRSEKPLEAVITGAEEVKCWAPYEKDVWTARIPNGIFGSYNPYTTEIFGDWYYGDKPVHTGEVYLNGRSMYECFSIEEVLKPVENPASWEPAYSLYKWYTEQDGDVTVLYANFQGADPNKENVEINVRRNCFYPDKTGVSYITLSGFAVKQAATTWAPPTAYQEGMIGPHWSKGWIIEDCEVSDSKCCGISLGKYLQPENENKWAVKRVKHGTQMERDAICQAQTEGWTKENIGSHIIRRCNIHHCEQTGIVGHLGGVFSIIEDNHIHHCTRGLWLDWQAQGTRVTQNLFHDNVPPAGTDLSMPLALGEDIFIEVSHGPTLVDNNVLLSTYSGKLATQGVAYVHNLICGSFTSVGEGTNNGGSGHERYTPYHVPHRTEVAGFMTFLHGDMRFYNNIFVQGQVPAQFLGDAQDETAMKFNPVVGTKPFDEYPTQKEFLERFFREGDKGSREDRGKYYDKMPVYTGGNVFFNGAQPCTREVNYRVDTEHKIYVRVTEKDGVYSLETNLYEFLPEFETGVISTETLGEAFQPEQKFENPDGTEIIFNEDYYGSHRGVRPQPGPFVKGAFSQEV